MSTAGSRLRKSLWMAASGVVLAALGLASGLALLAIPFLGLIPMAWTHPDEGEITYANSTAYTLWVYDREGDFRFELRPFETRAFSRYVQLWDPPMVAKTEDGRVVFSVDLTWDELKTQDYRIVIEEQGSSP
jgi:hypothetical protein